MSNYLPVDFSEDDTLYVKSYGFEDNSELAHWGGNKKNFCILHYVVSGEGYFNGNKVCENQGFFIKKNIYYEYHSSNDKPWNYFWMIISEDLAKKYAENLISIDGKGIFDYDFRFKLLELCNKIFCADVLDNEKALAYFFIVMSMHNNKTDVSVNRALIHVANAKLYIERNLNRKLTVSNVAKAISIDERYMYNLFKKYENISPKEYITRKKIELACYFLNNTEAYISEVALMIGFDDVCEFSKFFASNVGVSPTKFRINSKMKKTFILNE